MSRLASAVSFLVLLVLPPKSCRPLQWPRPAVGPFSPMGTLSWEQWLSDSEWEDKPSGTPARPGEGLFQDQSPLGSPCKLPRAKSTQQQRAERAASPSKWRDGRLNSLDLTFHLLREFLQMSREERLAQKARSNKLLLHSIGK